MFCKGTWTVSSTTLMITHQVHLFNKKNKKIPSCLDLRPENRQPNKPKSWLVLNSLFNVDLLLFNFQQDSSEDGFSINHCFVHVLQQWWRFRTEKDARGRGIKLWQRLADSCRSRQKLILRPFSLTLEKKCPNCAGTSINHEETASGWKRSQNSETTGI